MRYRLCVFSEGVKWVQDQYGIFWVNEKYLAEFLQLYKDKK